MIRLELDMEMDGGLGMELDMDGGFDMELDSADVVRSVENDYNRLINKPSIESRVLRGDKTFQQLGLGTITEQDIDNMLFGTP